jgi:hypothetical protein
MEILRVSKSLAASAPAVGIVCRWAWTPPLLLPPARAGKATPFLVRALCFGAEVRTPAQQAGLVGRRLTRRDILAIPTPVFLLARSAPVIQMASGANPEVNKRRNNSR